jgi:hypothetical protein
VDGFLWKTKCLDWWNDWIKNGWIHKKKQLYLWGPQNSGEKTFMKSLFNKAILFLPKENSNFPYADFDERKHQVIFMDNESHNMNLWKKIAAGEEFRVQIKGQRGRVAIAKMPMVMISNNPPPYDIPGFKERCEIIYSG